jgi:hypothetical protein
MNARTTMQRSIERRHGWRSARGGLEVTVQIYDPEAPGRRRWIGTFDAKNELIDAQRAASIGIAPSARVRTFQDWSMRHGGSCPAGGDPLALSSAERAAGHYLAHPCTASGRGSS